MKKSSSCGKMLSFQLTLLKSTMIFDLLVASSRQRLDKLMIFNIGKYLTTTLPLRTMRIMLCSVFSISCLSYANGNGFRKIYNETDILKVEHASLFYIEVSYESVNDEYKDLRRQIMKRNALTSLCCSKTLSRRIVYSSFE